MHKKPQLTALGVSQKYNRNNNNSLVVIYSSNNLLSHKTLHSFCCFEITADKFISFIT